MMAILGSHNTMTYLSPKLWIMRLFSLIWRCQKHDLKRQYTNGVRCFDLRVCYMNERWGFAHGLTKFDRVDLIEVLNYLNTKAVIHNEIIYIRLILESRKPDIHLEHKFKELCHEVRKRYFGRLKFFEARRKFDWLQLYDFDGFNPNVVQYVGSMRSWYGKICPWLYWKLNDKKNREKLSIYNDDTIVLFDFV